MKEILGNKKFTLIDVRSDWEFEAGHITGAIHIPLEEIQFKIAEIKNMQAPVILYCRSGNRSGMAANMLKQSGLQDIYNGGGISDLKHLMQKEYA